MYSISQAYSQATTVSTERASTPSVSNKPYLSGSSKQIPNEYLTTTDVTNSHNSKTFTLGGFSFIDQEYKDSTSNHKEGPRIKVINKNFKDISITRSILFFYYIFLYYI